MRAVLDTNVLIASILSPRGAPALLVEQWRAGRFELVVSEQLLAELARALGYSKLRSAVDDEEREAFVDHLRRHASVQADLAENVSPSPLDPDDAFVLNLAAHAGAALVTGDRRLLDLAREYPIYSPRSFVELLDRA